MLAEFQITLPAQTTATADPKGKTLLENTQATLGFIPNMYANMVNSPGLLEAYLTGYTSFRNDSGFTPPEQEVVFLTISRDNGCEYCVSAHSFLADMKSGLAPDVTDAIRNGAPIADAKLAALAEFTSVVSGTRGLPSKAATEAFLTAGYSQRQILEIVLALAVKTISNYSNHLFHTTLDPVFEGRRWSDMRSNG